MDDYVLRLEKLTKDFPGVRAVNEVSFTIKRNTVHCLVGENGAGKSTLIKILTGALDRTSGKIFLNSEECNFRNLKEAKNSGISTLFQELNTVDQLTVEENLTLGDEDTVFSFIRKTEKIKRIEQILKEIEPTIDTRMMVGDLSVAQKQLVEIARAVAAEANIIIMDEATAALSEREVKRLFRIIRDLKQKHVTFIYITHRINEVFEIGDYVTVMRDGRMIDTRSVVDFAGCMEEVDSKSGNVIRNINTQSACKELIKLMVGRVIYAEYQPGNGSGTEILNVNKLSNSKLKEISFSVNEGEIVGFYGLVGAGKSELARAVYGLDYYEGEIIFKNKKAEKSVMKMIQEGMVLVPEERRTQGLFTMLTVKNNIPVMNMKKVAKRGFIDTAKEREAALDYIDQLTIKTPSEEKEAAQLSGGNQQKIVFAKCLFADADLLILDEPTRGIDVGAKGEIYTIVRSLSKEGKSIMMFSSELQEIVNICDRIFLLYNGSIKAEIRNGGNIDSEKILHIVTGGDVSADY